MPPSEIIKKDRKKNENSLHINTLPKQKDRQRDPWISSPELIIHPVFEMRKKNMIIVRSDDYEINVFQ